MRKLFATPLRFPLGLIVLLATMGCQVSSEPEADTASVIEPTEIAQDTAAEQPTINFDGSELVLAFQTSDDTVTINEYISPDESLDSWTQIVGIHQYPGLQDPQQAVDGLVEQIQISFPDSPYQKWENSEQNAAGVDFIILGDNVVEFNVFTYRPAPGGNGLIAHQYAERAYGDDQQPFLVELRDRREEVSNTALMYDYPDIIRP